MTFTLNTNLSQTNLNSFFKWTTMYCIKGKPIKCWVDIYNSLIIGLNYALYAYGALKIRLVHIKNHKLLIIYVRSSEQFFSNSDV